jgi:hypothetical protein
MGEVRRGKNRNGNPPIELLRKKPLKQRTVAFVHEGKLVQYNRLAVDHVEPLLAALLLAKKPESIMFTFGRPDLEPVYNEPAPDWQRNSKLERRALDRERTKKRVDSKRCGTR